MTKIGVILRRYDTENATNKITT